MRRIMGKDDPVPLEKRTLSVTNRDGSKMDQPALVSEGGGGVFGCQLTVICGNSSLFISLTNKVK